MPTRVGRSDPAAGGVESVLGAVASLYVAGLAVDWKAFDAAHEFRHVPALPTYPFQEEIYWLKAEGGSSLQVAALGRAIKPPLSLLLGQQIASPFFEDVCAYISHMSAVTLPTLGDHTTQWVHQSIQKGGVMSDVIRSATGAGPVSRQWWLPKHLEQNPDATCTEIVEMSIRHSPPLGTAGAAA